LVVHAAVDAEPVPASRRPGPRRPPEPARVVGVVRRAAAPPERRADADPAGGDRPAAEPHRPRPAPAAARGPAAGAAADVGDGAPRTAARRPPGAALAAPVPRRGADGAGVLAAHRRA